MSFSASLDDACLTRIAEFCGEPDLELDYAENSQRGKFIAGIGNLARRFNQWYQTWCECEMSMSFHW